MSYAAKSIKFAEVIKTMAQGYKLCSNQLKSSSFIGNSNRVDFGTNIR